MIRTVLFAGSRKWKLSTWVRSCADKTLVGMKPGDKLVVIHGDHWEGTDRQIRQWAEEARAKWKADPASHVEVAEKRYTVTREEWKRVGSSAGPKRNARMVAENADVINRAYFFVLDPHLDESTGTLGCLKLAAGALISCAVMVEFTSRQLPRTGRADSVAGILREGRL
jgi:hypothetical protein